MTEAVANAVAGYGIAVLTQLVVFPVFEMRVPLSDNLAIGGVFTLVSLARTYVLRRLFETIRMRSAETRTAAPEGSGDSGVDRRQPAMR